MRSLTACANPGREDFRPGVALTVQACRVIRVSQRICWHCFLRGLCRQQWWRLDQHIFEGQWSSRWKLRKRFDCIEFVHQREDRGKNWTGFWYIHPQSFFRTTERHCRKRVWTSRPHLFSSGRRHSRLGRGRGRPRPNISSGLRFFFGFTFWSRAGSDILCSRLLLECRRTLIL